MPRPWQALDREIGEYLGELRELGRSEKMTIRPYEWTLRRLLQGLIDFKRPWNPRKIRKEDIEFLRDDFLSGTPRYKENQIKILLGFLRWARHKEVAKWRILFGDTSPTRVRWLDDDQARLVRAKAVGIEKMVVHLELDLGMRRIELLRLKVGSFCRGRNNTIQVHGKGRNGGKHRQISWHPKTSAILQEYLENVRNPAITKARSKNPKVKVPDSLFIYERGGELYPYKKTAIDQFLEDLGQRVGIHFTNHDLRRTCGRMMYRSGVRLEHIAKIFGHADTKTTIRYLGLDFDDMSDAMSKYAQYMENPFEPKMVQNEVGQEIGGQSGISVHETIWIPSNMPRTRH
jgi:integrase/recombinase XerD